MKTLGTGFQTPSRVSVNRIGKENTLLASFVSQHRMKLPGKNTRRVIGLSPAFQVYRDDGQTLQGLVTLISSIRYCPASPL
ncbi:hypothetical protein [Methyloglobulus sp.]|uniref:hypothetical protein n=1 Tax=Methyloglobulus sp. TaxID=2518622 RepID=UPI0032B7C5DD